MLESQCIAVSNFCDVQTDGYRNLLSRNVCTEFSVGRKSLSQNNMVWIFFPIMKGRHKLLHFLQVQFVLILACPVSVHFYSTLVALICLTSQLQSGSLRTAANKPKELIQTISFPKIMMALYTFHWLSISHSMLKLKVVIWS